MISKTSKWRVADVTDIHLGHPNTPTTEILDNLRIAFPDTPETGELDVIFFSGDVFDRLLQMPDENATWIRMWVNEFLRMCKRRDISVRVLEGTPSHDRGQSKLFTEVQHVGEIDVDLEYIDILTIRYIEKLGMSVLYVPDEWDHEPDNTWMQVQTLLKEHGLQKVDMAIMHGAFDYQLPGIAKAPVHIPERYLSIVEHYVFIGHIHLYSKYERIIAPGSFDRICHGEEGAKGHVRILINGNGPDEIVFVENKGAKVYKTIDCTSLDIAAALDKIDLSIGQYPNFSYIRVMAGKDDAIIVNLATLRQKFPTYIWSSKISTRTTSVDVELLVDMRTKYTSIAITNDNITSLLMDRLAGKLDSPALDRARELLIGVL